MKKIKIIIKNYSHLKFYVLLRRLEKAGCGRDKEREFVAFTHDTTHSWSLIDGHMSTAFF